MVGALFLSSLAALTAAILLSNRITGPIKKISSASRAIAEGNFTPSLEVAGEDELAALADNIKQMGRVLSKKIEQVIWEKNKLETVVLSMSSGVVLTDRELKIELINPAAEKMFDLDRDQAVGMPLQKAVRYHNLYENLKAVYEEGESKMIELNIYYPRRAVLETYLLPVSGADGNIIGALLLFHEVTHLRSIEKMRSDFVANVSHELRTPLTTLRGYTETILDEDLSREELVNFLQIIDKETKRLSGLLDDLLDLAQIENEKGFVKKDPVNLQAMLSEALRRAQEQAEQKEIIVDTCFPDTAIYVSGNYEWLSQAVVNILENSIRHGHTRGVINVDLITDGRTATVEIKDNGPGIPEADLPYVFERFYRVDKARSRKSGGTGLGLSIVKHIMEAHGASCELVSGAGEGTVFRFSLPVIEHTAES